MAITGAHIILHSSEPEKLRATLRDVMGWDHVDAGEGWLIFALPPAELSVHPSPDTRSHHELSLMCDLTCDMAGGSGGARLADLGVCR
jgi:hypothetical protein